MNHSDIPGHGYDASPTRRPGVPMERPPEDLSDLPSHVECQVSEVTILRHPGQRVLPPVYGSAQPPKALSGLLRRWAYRQPTHEAKHWLTLMAADRIDVLEHRLSGLRIPLMLITGVALGRWALQSIQRAE